MSELRLSHDAFLEKIELDRWKKFLDQDGFRNFLIQHTDEFGVIRKENAPFLNALVQEDLSLTIKINEIKAINSNGQLIYSKPISSLSIPADNTWYWVKIAYQQSIVENGVFSIDTFGNLVCTSGDAELTKILRGQPNYPSRITFTNASNNVLDYDVLEVVDDNNALLSGQFATETNLNLAIVGTFTPGYTPTIDEKYLFRYDSCLLTLVPSTTIYPPAHTLGLEFIIGRAKNDGSAIKVEDKRLEIWKVDSNYFLHNLDRLANPLVGVEQITYDDAQSTLTENIVQVAWAFRADTFTVNPKLNSITISSGEGGIFKSNTFNIRFANGDFDGWRVYAASGNYFKIKTSSKVSSSIELIMDSLNSADFFQDLDSVFPITQNLLITPDAEEIEFSFIADPASANQVVAKKCIFPINSGYGRVKLNVYGQDYTTLYNVTYRYKHLRDYSPILLFPQDIAGFYAEDQFQNNGNLIASPVRTPYTPDPINGFIPLRLNGASYSNFVEKIDLGDLFGVTKRELDNSIPVIELTIGGDRQYQYFGDQDNSVFNDQITLTADMFIDLKKTNSTGNPCKNGNTFYIHIKQYIILSTFQFRIVTDYVNPTTFTELKFLTNDDSIFLAKSEQGLFIRASFDGTEWILNSTNEVPSLKFFHTRQELMSFNAGGVGQIISNPSFSTLSIGSNPFEVTTPNDGILRQCQVTFKASVAIPNSGTDGGIDARIIDLSGNTVFDYGTVYLAKAVSTDNMTVTICLTVIQYFQPNVTLSVQLKNDSNVSNSSIRDVQFSMIEIGRP